MLTIEEIRETLGRLNELSDDELATFRAALIEFGQAISADDAEITDDTVGVMQEVSAAFDTVAGEVQTREEAAEARDQARQALRDQIRAQSEGDPDEGDEGDPDPAEAEPEPEAVAAAATPPARRPSPRRPRSSQPAPQTERRASLVASANVPSVTVGEDLSDTERLSFAFSETYRAGLAYQGGRTLVPVAVGRYDWPEELTLTDNEHDNARKLADGIRQHRAAQALTAAGGICAPAPIQYDLPVIGSSARPIRDALPNFGATRGAVRTIRPPVITDVGGGTQANPSTSGVTIWTEANDQTPSAPATKPCLTLTCPTTDTTAVDAIVQCFKVGNFRDRFFPEQVAAVAQMMDVWTARVAEQNLIAKIAAGSTTFTTGTVLGTTRDILAALDRHLATVRYWFRLDDVERFRLLAPRWLRDNMRTDLAREQPGATAERLATADAEIAQFFSSRNVNVSWIMEGESSQRFGAPNAGQVAPWPSHALMYLFVEGTWTYLNGGTLQLGVVRDTTNNATNDFTTFGEVFEQVHFHGTFSHKIDVDICPSGATSLPVAVSVCTSGS